MTDIKKLSDEIKSEINCVGERLALLIKKSVLVSINTERGIITSAGIKVYEND